MSDLTVLDIDGQREPLTHVALQESLAMRVPGNVMDQYSRPADYLGLEFWRGTICVGDCKLPINSMKEAAASQVTWGTVAVVNVFCRIPVLSRFSSLQTSSEVRTTNLRPDLRQPPISGGLRSAKSALFHFVSEFESEEASLQLCH